MSAATRLILDTRIYLTETGLRYAGAMTTKEIAHRLVDLCKEGKNFDAMRELYADDIVSVEAAPREGISEFQGKEPVIAKSADWAAAHEIHKLGIEGPFVSGDRFATIFDISVTPKATGQRVDMREIALYDCAGGKIVCEEFFYDR